MSANHPLPTIERSPAAANRRATILWHTIRMPDEDQLFLRPRQPPTYDERHPLGSDLEFIMRRIAALPTQCELIRFGVWVALGLCVVALVGLRMWDRYIAACSSN